MSDEIEIISDGDGIAIFGEASLIDGFLHSNSLQGRELDMSRVKAAQLGSEATTAASAISASGRWVRITKDSFDKISQGHLMKGSASGLQRSIVQGASGKIQHIVQFEKGVALLANPAILAGVGGIMSQYAMQHAMDELAEYLAVIDAKVDDILRAQKDAVLADRIGVDLVIDEAMQLRDQVGRVSETTWSKVQSTSLTIARTQAYALRQLDALAGKLEKQKKAGGLETASKEVEATVQECLAVLARCFQLQDGIAILELDRVLDGSPDEVERHRSALRSARERRLETITRSRR